MFGAPRSPHLTPQSPAGQSVPMGQGPSVLAIMPFTRTAGGGPDLSSPSRKRHYANWPASDTAACDGLSRALPRATPPGRDLRNRPGRKPGFFRSLDLMQVTGDEEIRLPFQSGGDVEGIHGPQGIFFQKEDGLKDRRLRDIA